MEMKNASVSGIDKNAPSFFLGFQYPRKKRTEHTRIKRFNQNPMNFEPLVHKVPVKRGRKKKMNWKQRKRLSQNQENKPESPIIDLCDSDEESESLAPLVQANGDNKTMANEEIKQENDNMNTKKDDSSPSLSPKSEVIFNGDMNENPYNYLTPEKKYSLKKMNILESDLQKLNQGECVNDVIINFYINHLKNNVLVDKNSSSRFSFFNTFFFCKLVQIDKEINRIITSHYKESFHERLKLCLRWTKDENIFEKDYVFFPIFDNEHWSLCILCFPREVGLIHSRSTLLHLDSYTPGHQSTMMFRSIRRFLNVELKEAQKNNSELNINIPKVKKIFAKHIPGHRLEVPQQDNYVDCGCFLLHFIQHFITNIPTTLDTKYLNEEMFGLNCFHPSEPSKLRIVIKKLMLSKIGMRLPSEENINLIGTKRKLSIAFKNCYSITNSNKRVKFDTQSSINCESEVQKLNLSFKSIDIDSDTKNVTSPLENEKVNAISVDERVNVVSDSEEIDVFFVNEQENDFDIVLDDDREVVYVMDSDNDSKSEDKNKDEMDGLEKEEEKRGLAYCNLNEMNAVEELISFKENEKVVMENDIENSNVIEEDKTMLMMIANALDVDKYHRMNDDSSDHMKDENMIIIPYHNGVNDKNDGISNNNMHTPITSCNLCDGMINSVVIDDINEGKSIIMNQVMSNVLIPITSAEKIQDANEMITNDDEMMNDMMDNTMTKCLNMEIVNEEDAILNKDVISNNGITLNNYVILNKEKNDDLNDNVLLNNDIILKKKNANLNDDGVFKGDLEKNFTQIKEANEKEKEEEENKNETSISSLLSTKKISELYATSVSLSENKEGEDGGEGIGSKKIEMKSSQTICLLDENVRVYERRKKHELCILNSASKQNLFQTDNMQPCMKMIESSNTLAIESSFPEEKRTPFINEFKTNNNNNIDIIEHSLNKSMYDIEFNDANDSNYNIHSFDVVDVSNGLDDKKGFFAIPYLPVIDQSSMARSSSLPLPITYTKKERGVIKVLKTVKRKRSDRGRFMSQKIFHVIHSNVDLVDLDEDLYSKFTVKKSKVDFDSAHFGNGIIYYLKGDENDEGDDNGDSKNFFSVPCVTSFLQLSPSATNDHICPSSIKKGKRKARNGRKGYVL